MPWQIERRDGEYCVVKEGETDPVPGGCHPNRIAALKHQRALYANEARVAAIYEKLDAVEEEAAPALAAAQEIRIVLDRGRADEALQASFVQALAVIADRLAAGERVTESLVAALTAAGQQPTIVVQPADVTVQPTPIVVESPSVTVEAPNVTVQPPDIRVEPMIMVEPAQPPDVHIEPQIILPPERPRQVVFERDPAGRLTGATVEEG